MIVVSFKKLIMVVGIAPTYIGFRFIIQNLLNLVQHFWSQFRNDFNSLEVFRDLLGFRRAKNDGGSVRVLRNPCQSKY